jgi:hypothetical protein
MASNFPSSLDSFTNPSSSDAMDSVSVPHASQHSDLNDAVEALQAKVGADSSGVASSHDYKIAQLEALGGYTDYSATATYTNFTLGNGTAALFYTQIGDLVHFVGRFLLGSTSSVTGSWVVNLPVAVGATGAYLSGTAVFIDSGTAFYSGVCTVSSGNNTLAFRAPKITATYTRWDTVGTSVPMTWATGDELNFNITYKAA